MAGRSSQKSSESEPRLSVSRSHLEDDGSEPRPQHLQASHSSDSGPLGSLGLSHGSPVAWEYLPFFRTYGKLLAVEEPASRPQVCRDRGGDQNTPEDLEPPSGFFPHYRSKEESFPCLGLPGGSCQSSQDLRLTKEALVGCFCRLTGSCRCSVSRRAALGPLDPLQASAPGPHTAILASPDVVPRSLHSPPCCPILLLSAGCSRDSSPTVLLSSDAAFRSQALCASGFVPYYRTPEEELHTSPGPPTSPSGSGGPTGELPRPGAAIV
ncbi:uncharacterized protein AAEQ78_015685 isoform 2-T3 [Lycaon pictus]